MSEYTADMTVLLTSEPEAEPHIVITRDKTVIVPDELRAIATQFEKNIETVTFDCPRYWDEHDLSTMNMYINYRRADGKDGPSFCGIPVVDAEDENVVHFDWTLSDHATYAKGRLSFVACAKKADENGELINRWSSRLNQEIEILEGIEVDTSEIIMPSADIIEQMLALLGTATESSERFANEAKTSADAAEDAAERAIAAAQSVTVVKPNLLDNWYFADPVNQRGQTEYTAGYTIDRWIKNGGTGTIAITNSGLAFDTGGGASVGIAQMIESYEKYKGRTVTISAIMDGQLYSYTFVLGFASGGFTLGKCRVFSLDAMHVLLRVYAEDVGANPVNIAAVKLELGDKQTLAHQDASGNWVLNEIPDKGAELAKCQRYQLSLWGSLGTYATLGFARVSGVSIKTAEVIVPIPVTMRTNPTLVTGNAVFQLYNNETEYAAVTSIAFSAIAPGFVRLYIVASKELTGGGMYVLRKTTDDLVLLDANL